MRCIQEAVKSIHFYFCTAVAGCVGGFSGVSVPAVAVEGEERGREGPGGGGDTQRLVVQEMDGVGRRAGCSTRGEGEGAGQRDTPAIGTSLAHRVIHQTKHYLEV